MKRVRGLATILYYVSRMTAILCLMIGAYALIIMTLSLGMGMEGLPVEFSGGHFTIFLPFSKIPFLMGDNTSSYLSTSISIVALYGIFLWLLSAVFKAFMQKKLFVPKSVKRLTHFYLFNFFVPAVYIICLLLFGQEIRDAVIIVGLHLMIAVFIFFMATIFKQGLVLQEEQDLTL